MSFHWLVAVVAFHYYISSNYFGIFLVCYCCRCCCCCLFDCCCYCYHVDDDYYCYFYHSFFSFFLVYFWWEWSLFCTHSIPPLHYITVNSIHYSSVACLNLCYAILCIRIKSCASLVPWIFDCVCVCAFPEGTHSDRRGGKERQTKQFLSLTIIYYNLQI